MSKITFNEYLEIVRNPETDDNTILSLSIVEKGQGGFDYTIKPDPQKVELTPEDIAFENAFKIGNGLSRFRRQLRFRRRKLLGSKLPILVSEGDSWFQFPFLVREVIDQLEKKYLIWSVGAAGDTAENIVYGRAEYLEALHVQKDNVRGFLFSAAGNDIIGRDTKTGKSVLYDLLKDYNSDTQKIAGHINMDLLEEKLDFLKGAYRKVVDDIRAQPEFTKLPIFIHGYDYPFPYKWDESDHRKPRHAHKNQWLGAPLDQRNYKNPQLRRDIIKFLIDQLYLMLEKVSGNPQETGVWLVDCRGAMPDVNDWIDEIHGNSEGFKKVAKRFIQVISQAI